MSDVRGRAVVRVPRVSGVAGELEELFAPLFGGALPIGLKAWDGSRAGAADAPVLVLRSPMALRRLVWHPGELGLAQAYVTGELDVEGDLAAGFRRVWAAARERLDGGSAPGARELARMAPRLLRLAVRHGALGAPLPAPDSQARLRGRLHDRLRDRAAIAHHYDLSNAFYALVLDESMAYSCGYWTQDGAAYGLAEAQADKFDLVCRKLGLRAGDRLLDVGCGWGSLSIHAARQYGARVTGITLSQQQAEFARARVKLLGLQDLVRIELRDYRELSTSADPPFDAVASLEMGEHVGQANYPVYATTLHRMVAPGGRVLVQQMSRGTTAPGGGAFIEAYIAPDMHMRPVGETVAFLERAGLEVRDVHALREHYVRTVEAWTATFESRWDEVVDLVGEEVARVWRLYLVGGGLAFEEGRMGVDQILAVRPHAGGVSGMPAVRVL